MIILINPIYYKPETTVELYFDIHLDNSYTDTFWFANRSDQYSFFSGKTKKVFTGTFQRVNTALPPSTQGNTGTPRKENTVRVNAPFEEIYTANYLAFQNKQVTGNRWFYAFINKINPISSNACEIEYEIDMFQTWFFDCKVGESFVLREHPRPDNEINLQPENISIGEKNYYLIENITPVRYDIYAIVSSDPEGRKAPRYSWMVGDIPQALGYQKITSYTSGTNPQTISQTIGDFVSSYLNENNGSAILDIKIVPIFNAVKTSYNFNSLLPSLHWSKVKTSPFMQIIIRDSVGNEQAFSPELMEFEPISSNFNISFLQNSLGDVMIYPVNYVNSKPSDAYNFTIETAISTGYGGTVYSAIMEGAWISSIFSALGASGDNAKNSITETPLNELNIVKPIASTTNNLLQATLKKGRSSGVVSGGGGKKIFYAGLSNEKNKYKIGLYLYTATSESLKRIDKFFDEFGYATNLYKIPNGLTPSTQTTFLSFNYIQMVESKITGSVPNEAIFKIKEIFANGVRLWHNVNDL